MFRLTDHIERLLDSAKLIMMEIPYSRRRARRGDARTPSASSGLDSCYIRPIAFLGYGEMGLNPLPCEVNVSIAVWPWGAYLGDESLDARRADEDLVVAAHGPERQPGRGQGHRHLHQLEPGQGRGAARRATTRRSCSTRRATSPSAPARTSSSSKNGVLVTPPLSSGALDGITRDSVMTIARDLGYEVREEQLLRRDLYLADEAFLTGTAAEVVPDPLGRRPRDRRPGRDHPQAPGDLLRHRPRPGRAVQGLVGACPLTMLPPYRDPSWPARVEIYDTTLRDGSQLEGISLTVDDKLRIAEQLDWLGVDYIEAGLAGRQPEGRRAVPARAERARSSTRARSSRSARRAG